MTIVYLLRKEYGMNKKERIEWETQVGDLLEKWTIRYYSFNRERRYQRAVKALARYITHIWELRHREDSRLTEFTLTYFISKKREGMLLHSDFALSLFTHGFRQSEKSHVVDLMTRINYLKYQMHPANAYHQCITPEEEMKLMYDIVGAFPIEELRKYDFEVHDLPVFKGDWEMQPEEHWMKCFIFTKKEYWRTTESK